MNPSQFVNPDMGQIVEIDRGEVAFVPAALPTELPLGLEVWELLAEAATRVGQLAGVVRTRLVREPTVLIRPLQVREALLSSITEGIDVGGDDLLLFELDEPGLNRSTERYDARLEALNLVRAIEDAMLIDSRPFTIEFVCALHAKLMDGVRGHNKRPGELRRGQVFIGVDHRFVPPPPHLMRDCLEDWRRWARDDSIRIHPLVRACMLHYHFEAIHPFLDGNGRVGRLLWSLMMARWTPLELPWLFLSPFIERHRREYGERLLDVSTRGDWDGWLAFCLRGIAHEAIDSFERIGGLLDLWSAWRQLIESGDLKPRALPLLEHLLSHPYVEATYAAIVMDCHYVTAKGDLEKLQALGVVAVVEGRSPLTYVAASVRGIMLEDEWKATEQGS